MKITYLAGPMRGYPKFNFEAFYDLEDSLSGLGWKCLNPARMDMEQFPGVSDPDKLPSQPMEAYVERDMNALLMIKRMVTKGEATQGAVHFLPGWHKSVGAKAEHAIAEWLGLELIYL